MKNCEVSTFERPASTNPYHLRAGPCLAAQVIRDPKQPRFPVLQGPALPEQDSWHQCAHS